MHIQVNTGRDIRADESLSAEVNRAVEGAVRRFSEQITRLEVHLSDENSDKKSSGTGEMRCVIEARLKGRQPTAVTHRAATISEAVDGAAEKLTRSIESILGRLRAPTTRAGKASRAASEPPGES